MMYNYRQFKEFIINKYYLIFFKNMNNIFGKMC